MDYTVWPNLHARCGNSQHVPNAVLWWNGLLYTVLYGYCICKVCWMWWPPFLFSFQEATVLYNNPLPPSKALVMLSVLASIEFWEPCQLPPRISFPYLELQIPADGRCFWSSIFLGTQASSAQLWSWAHRARNSTGFASGEDMLLEKNLVWEWLQQLLAHMDPGCRARVESFECACHDDIVPCHTVVYLLAGLFCNWFTARFLPATAPRRVLCTFPKQNKCSKWKLLLYILYCAVILLLWVRTFGWLFPVFWDAPPCCYTP